MKRQRTQGFTAQPNRRLLLSCAAALALLAPAMPGLAQQGAAAGQTAQALKASLFSTASCPAVKCLITCENGLDHFRYFDDTSKCYANLDEAGCYATGIWTCSDKPAADGC